MPTDAMSRTNMSPPMARPWTAHETPTRATIPANARRPRSAGVIWRGVRTSDLTRERTGSSCSAAMTSSGPSTSRKRGSRVQSAPRPGMASDELAGPMAMATSSAR